MYQQPLLHSEVTAPDNTFHGPRHPQTHPSLGNPGVHPLLTLTLLENPGLRVLFRAQRSLATQESARSTYPPTSSKLLSPFRAPSFALPPT